MDTILATTEVMPVDTPYLDKVWQGVKGDWRETVEISDIRLGESTLDHETLTIRSRIARN